MKKAQTVRIAIYSRKSKFTGKGESVENQIELCRQYIRTHFPDADENCLMIYEDEGYSGGHTDRPRFKAMMRDAHNRMFSAIICYRLDRISRNIGDFAKLIEELESLNVSFVSIKEQFDTSSPIGRAMMYISSVFSQLERETIAERIRDNMLELAKTGRWLGGTTPTGYESVPVESVTVDGKVHKAYKLSSIPSEIAIVQLIFRKFLELNSLTKVETYLLQNHILTKNGKNFTRFSIRTILDNPVYVIADENSFEYFEKLQVEIFGGKESFDGKHGIMAYNKTIQKKGQANQIRSKSEWIIAPGRHDGAVDSSEWIQAQVLLEQNKSKSYRKPKSSASLLSGMLYCACGAHMRPKQSRRLNKDNEFVFSYLCETKEKSLSRLCNLKNPSGNTLDRLVCEAIKNLPTDLNIFITEFESVKERISLFEDEADAELERMKITLADTEKEINTLVTALSRSPESTHEYFTKQIKVLHEKSTSLRQKVSELLEKTENDMLSDDVFTNMLNTLSAFGKTFDVLNVEQKRAILRSLVSKVVWNGENAVLHLVGA